MAWLILILAGICEVAWAFGLKKFGLKWGSYGSGFTVVMMILSFWLLSLAMDRLPLGTAYVVWTGIGAVGAAVLGMAFLGEPRDLVRVGCIALIVTGIVGLKAFTRDGDKPPATNAPPETTSQP